jgi:hypothetical protein
VTEHLPFDDLFSGGTSTPVTALSSGLVPGPNPHFDLSLGPRNATEELTGEAVEQGESWRVGAGEIDEDLSGLPYFSTADWRLDEVDENGRSKRTAALIASIEASAAEDQGVWGRLKEIWHRH